MAGRAEAGSPRVALRVMGGYTWHEVRAWVRE